MSAVKRVQAQLNQVEARAVQSAQAKATTGPGSMNPRKRKAEGADPGATAVRLAAERVVDRGRGVSDEVVVRGCGRAIERVLAVGRWFEDHDGYRIAIRTGTVRTVDDIERVEDEEGGVAGQDEMEVDAPQDNDEVPEAWVRQVSYVEVAVALA